MREHEVNSLDTFIKGWYIDDSDTICNYLINKFESIDNPKLKAPANVHQPVSKKFKESIDWTLDNDSLVLQPFVKKLVKVTNHYIDIFPKCDAYSSFGLVENVNLQKYEPGMAFRGWHSENCTARNPQTTRHLVFMTYLNDVEEGGETEWYHQKLKIKPEKGLTVVWPADWTYTHRGCECNHTKYILTGWLNYISDEAQISEKLQKVLDEA